MPVTFSSYRPGPGQRASYKTVPPPWDWLLRRENELGPRRSKSQIIFAVLVPPLYVAVQAPALIVTDPARIVFIFNQGNSEKRQLDHVIYSPQVHLVGNYPHPKKTKAHFLKNISLIREYCMNSSQDFNANDVDIMVFEPSVL